jgi:hypothetical protein
MLAEPAMTIVGQRIHGGAINDCVRASAPRKGRSRDAERCDKKDS